MPLSVATSASTPTCPARPAHALDHNLISHRFYRDRLLQESQEEQPRCWGEVLPLGRALITSRLTEYGLRIRLNARGLAGSHGENTTLLLRRLAWLELAPPVLARALEPFPTPVRTLDTLHLASADFLRRHGQKVRLASYDARLNAAARAIELEPYPRL